MPHDLWAGDFLEDDSAGHNAHATIKLACLLRGLGLLHHGTGAGRGLVLCRFGGARPRCTHRGYFRILSKLGRIRVKQFLFHDAFGDLAAFLLALSDGRLRARPPACQLVVGGLRKLDSVLAIFVGGLVARLSEIEALVHVVVGAVVVIISRHAARLETVPLEGGLLLGAALGGPTHIGACVDFDHVGLLDCARLVGLSTSFVHALRWVCFSTSLLQIAALGAF